MQLTWISVKSEREYKSSQGEADTTSEVLNLLAFCSICLGHINHTSRGKWNVSYCRGLRYVPEKVMNEGGKRV